MPGLAAQQHRTSGARVPELPEVETICRGIAPAILGRRVESLEVREARLRWPVPPNLAQRVRGQQVQSVRRRGKYLIVELERLSVLIHLGMSGRLFVLPPGETPGKHDHVDWHFSGATSLRFRDPRRFGAIVPWEGRHLALIDTLGPEPLGEDFDAGRLYRETRGRQAPIKALIMDARVVVGVGNIYATEALFRAGILPHRRAGRLSRADCERLVDAIRVVLERAIELGGTTLRDFVDARGEAGYFQQDLMAYGREGEACRACGTLVRRRVIGQRSSFYCPRCQR